MPTMCCPRQANSRSGKPPSSTSSSPQHLHLRAPVLDALPVPGGAGDLRPADASARHRRPRPTRLLRTAAKLGRRPYNGVRRTARADKSSRAPTCCTRRSARPCPATPAPPPCCGHSPNASRRLPAGMRRAGHATPTRSSTPFSRVAPVSPSPSTTTPTPGLPSATRQADLLGNTGIPTCATSATTSATHTSAEFPFVLAAGERRSFTANTIFRDKPGVAATPTARCASIPTMRPTRPGHRRPRASPLVGAPPLHRGNQRPHATRPCFLAQRPRPRPSGRRHRAHRRRRQRTHRRQWRDAIAGTPWHKHVPARIEPVPS